MKRWHSLVFIFIFTANALAIAVMGIWYTNDKAYFTNNFCVNIEKVELQCNGRCHLQKQINGQTTDTEKQEISVPLLEFEFLVTSDYSIKKPFFNSFRTQNFIPYSMLYRIPHLPSDDIPPIA